VSKAEETLRQIADKPLTDFHVGEAQRLARAYFDNVEPCRCVYPDKCFCSEEAKALRDPALDKINKPLAFTLEPRDPLDKRRAVLKHGSVCAWIDYDDVNPVEADAIAEATVRGLNEFYVEHPALPPYDDAVTCLNDAISYLGDPDPEDALRSIEEAAARIRAAM
jgi:hypothetical protein